MSVLERDARKESMHNSGSFFQARLLFYSSNCTKEGIAGGFPAEQCALLPMIIYVISGDE